MYNPTHKHTHLQATHSRHTNLSLQKSVLFANAKPTDNRTDEKGQQITAVWRNGGGRSSYENLC